MNETNPSDDRGTRHHSNGGNDVETTPIGDPLRRGTLTPWPYLGFADAPNGMGNNPWDDSRERALHNTVVKYVDDRRFSGEVHV